MPTLNFNVSIHAQLCRRGEVQPLLAWISTQSKTLLSDRRKESSPEPVLRLRSLGFLWPGAPRSGLAVKNGLDVLAGVIDSDYRGEVCCAFLNTGDEAVNLPQGR